MKLFQALLILAAIGWGTMAVAGPSPSKLDVAPILDKLAVFETKRGHHIILVPSWETKAVARTQRSLSKLITFGKRGKYYQQYVYSFNSFPNFKLKDPHVFEYGFWHGPIPAGGILKYKQGVLSLTCGTRTVTTKRIEGAARQRILQRASFYTNRWQRKAVVLAQDNQGRFYYVDKQTKGADGHRLYYGRKGRLRRLRLASVTKMPTKHVFAARKGALVLTPSKTRGQRHDASWATKWGSKKTLTYMPLSRKTRAFVYGRLGVYRNKRFGTPCDVR